jgi:hypothetical protein
MVRNSLRLYFYLDNAITRWFVTLTMAVSRGFLFVGEKTNRAIQGVVIFVFIAPDSPG